MTAELTEDQIAEGKLRIADPPKDQSVIDDQEEFQMGQLPLFDGHRIEKIAAQIKAGDVTLGDDTTCPKYMEQRAFIVTGKCVQVAVKEVPVKGLPGFTRTTRVHTFEIEESVEVSRDVFEEYAYTDEGKDEE